MKQILEDQILEDLCKDKIGWDEDLPDHILPQREQWLKELPHLAALKIPRSYIPPNFGEAVQYELHSFSDTSFNGYGACILDPERQRTIGCEFLMNVPAASHMGGVWERQLCTTIAQTGLTPQP